jgi:hypothetical protein
VQHTLLSVWLNSDNKSRFSPGLESKSEPKFNLLQDNFGARKRASVFESVFFEEDISLVEIAQILSLDNNKLL